MANRVVGFVPPIPGPATGRPHVLLNAIFGCSARSLIGAAIVCSYPQRADNALTGEYFEPLSAGY